MLAVLSPSKTLDFESDCPPHHPTVPRFLDDSAELIASLRRKSRSQLRELMGISENLAEVNRERYRNWSLPFTEDNARAALLAFKGDVYTGISASEYSADDFAFAQDHLRILSGLYGVLRPLDLIQPYRLEMGVPLKTRRGKDLYRFWGGALTENLAKSIEDSGSAVLVNLASKEYFSAIQPRELSARVITPHFKDLKNGTYKFLSFYGKKARGMMADFMIRERITEPTDLKKFRMDGYRYHAKLSDGDDWVFTRDNPPSA